MARGDFPSAKQDQFVLRFPDGLRDRIKAYAERHGRSMNAEIIRVLEREYPEPWSIDGRVADLMAMLRIIKGGATDERIDRLTRELEETVLGMATGRVRGVDDKAMKNIDWLWTRYQEQRAEDNEALGELDDVEMHQLSVSGRTEKFEPPLPERKKLGNFSDQEFDIYKQGYEAALASLTERSKSPTEN